jgi:hypothetical protein
MMGLLNQCGCVRAISICCSGGILTFAAPKESEPKQGALFKIKGAGGRDNCLPLQLGGLFCGWNMAEIDDG